MAEGKTITAETGADGGVVVNVGSTQEAHADAELLRVGHSIGSATNRQGVSKLRVMGDGRVLAAGGLGAGNAADGDTLGTVVKKLEVFDADGNSLGHGTLSGLAFGLLYYRSICWRRVFSAR